MSGVSPELVAMKERITARVERKKEQLEKAKAAYDAGATSQAKLLVEIEALEIGIAEDEELLSNSAPKVRRQRKAKAPQTLGQQMGTDPKEGQA